MTLRERLEVYYGKHDPEKVDNDGITPIVAWVEQHGEDLLRERLEAKYGEPLPVEADVPAEVVEEEERRWAEVRVGLTGFYASKNVDKTSEELEHLMRWTKKRGLSSLNHQLFSKYGESLKKEVLPSWGALFAEGQQKQIEDEDITKLLNLFFAKHDPDKPSDDVEFLAGYAVRHGVDPVNEQLRLNFGLGLEDVCEYTPPPVPSKPDLDNFKSSRAAAEKKNLPSNGGAVVTAPPREFVSMAISAAVPETPEALEKRRAHVAALLENYYLKASPDMLQLGHKEQFDGIVTYGVTKGLKKLNLALEDKYGTDLDDLKRRDLRASVAGFLEAQMRGSLASGADKPSDFDPWANDMQNVEKVVEFGLEHGILMMDEALQREYGANLAGEEAI